MQFIWETFHQTVEILYPNAILDVKFMLEIVDVELGDPWLMCMQHSKVTESYILASVLQDAVLGFK